MIAKIIQKIALVTKKILYGKRGEPYDFGGEHLRFSVGTRPVRTKYRTSPNTNVRNDARQVELVESVLKGGDIAIDVGAHAGQYSMLMSSRCGRAGSVYAFEPDPGAVVLLKENFALNPKLKEPSLEFFACSDSNGSASFFSQGGNSQSSLIRTGIAAGQDLSEITVKTIRLDDWWMQKKLVVPKLIKIDTEGAEIKILQGMPKLLATDTVVVCELHPYAWQEIGCSFAELDEVSARSGRTIECLDGRGAVVPPVEYGTVVLRRK